MAGFFGLFDYSKPGPGVDKNAPKKKNFIEFWEIFFRKFWKLVQINLCYVLTCLPVVTVGLANAGMTYVTRNFVREKPVFTWEEYLETIKKNWKQALPVGIINLIVTIVLVWDVTFFYEGYAASKEVIQLILLSLIGCFYVVFTIMKYYIYMMMITFRFSVKQLYKNAMLMVSAGLKSNLIISGILLLFYALMIVPAFFSLQVAIVLDSLLLIFIFPAFRSLLIQYYIFPVIRKYIIEPYYKEHPEEKKDAVRILNVYVENENGEPDPEENKDEPVFKDMGSTKPEESEKPASETVIPKQYSERELRGRGRERLKKQDNDDDVI